MELLWPLFGFRLLVSLDFQGFGYPISYASCPSDAIARHHPPGWHETCLEIQESRTKLLLVGGWTTHLKNISQIGSFPQVGVNINNIWNHHLGNFELNVYICQDYWHPWGGGDTGHHIQTCGNDDDTVDGWNPAPPRMMIIPLFIGFHTSQVVQDFSHQQYQSFSAPKCDWWIAANPPRDSRGSWTSQIPYFRVAFYMMHQWNKYWVVMGCFDEHLTINIKQIIEFQHMDYVCFFSLHVSHEKVRYITILFQLYLLVDKGWLKGVELISISKGSDITSNKQPRCFFHLFAINGSKKRPMKPHCHGNLSAWLHLLSHSLSQFHALPPCLLPMWQWRAWNLIPDAPCMDYVPTVWEEWPHEQGDMANGKYSYPMERLGIICSFSPRTQLFPILKWNYFRRSHDTSEWGHSWHRSAQTAMHASFEHPNIWLDIFALSQDQQFGNPIEFWVKLQ